MPDVEMAMEGDADHGFERLLMRLDDATRLRYCAEALDDELRDVLAQFQQCAQAMDHARQVDDATQSLIANASTAIHMGSATATQCLSDLHGLHKAMTKSIRTMKGSAESAVLMQPAMVVEEKKEEEKEEEEKASEESKLLEKTRSLLTKQRRSSWLADAVETARSAVRLMVQKAEEMETKRGDKTDFSPADLRIYEVFKLLRKCILKEAAANVDLVPVLRKLLKRLAKKRPRFAGFAEKSEELLAVKEAKLAAKQTEEAAATSTSTSATAPPAKSKKRRLAETTLATTTVEDVKIKIQPQEHSVSRATLDVRSKSQLCSVKTNALRDGFSLAAYDICLRMMIEVVNAITPQLTGEDTAVVSATLVMLVNKAMTIDAEERRTSRLACLEGLLGVLVRAERLEWSSAHAKATVLECRTKCRNLLELNAEPVVAADASSKVPGKRKKREKVAGSHMRFDGNE